MFKHGIALLHVKSNLKYKAVSMNTNLKKANASHSDCIEGTNQLNTVVYLMLQPFFFIIQVSDGRYFERNGTAKKILKYKRN